MFVETVDMHYLGIRCLLDLSSKKNWLAQSHQKQTGQRKGSDTCVECKSVIKDDEECSIQC